MMNEYELAQQVKSETPDEIYNEIFELVKNNPKLLNEIVHTHVSFMTDKVSAIKEVVKLYNEVEKKLEEDKKNQA